MKFSELGTSRYFVPNGTYETNGVCSYKINPDLETGYTITLDGAEVRTISHPRKADNITIWRQGAKKVDLPVDSEFALDIDITRRLATI